MPAPDGPLTYGRTRETSPLPATQPAGLQYSLPGVDCIKMSTPTLQQLSERMRRGELTSATLTERLLARAHAAEAVLHAFTAIYAEHAMAQARALDAERARGRVRGALHGIPLALKDVFDIARQRTTGGSLLYAERFAAADAAVVKRLLDAGAVILGKTRLAELAFGGWGTNAATGTPRNPWDLGRRRAPGGSSSGAAVAVAAGIVPAALGTDTGGSVRIPAALCGVVGLKTTAGQIPRDGTMLLSPTLDTVGPIASTVADVALLHAALTGSEPPDHRNIEGSIDMARTQRVRVGVLSARELEDVDADVLEGCEDMARHLSELGAALSEVALPERLDAYVERMSTIIGYEGWQAHGLRILQNPDVMDPHVRERFLAGQRVTPSRYRAVLEDQAAAQAAMRTALERFDVLLTPATPLPAPLLDDVDEAALPLSRYTRAINYLGLCALALPSRLSAAGLPVGVQLVGKPHAEPLLLALGAALEAARGPFPVPNLTALGLPS